MDDEPVEILCDVPGWSTSVILWCSNDHEINGPDVVLRDCPHHNGTKIEHCPVCDDVLGITAGPMRLSDGDAMPDCACWHD
jgi:hypothetical protein